VGSKLDAFRKYEAVTDLTTTDSANSILDRAGKNFGLKIPTIIDRPRSIVVSALAIRVFIGSFTVGVHRTAQNDFEDRRCSALP